MKRSTSITILSMMMILLSKHAFAQPSFLKGMEVESDPIAYFLKGYSLHVAYTLPQLRLSVGAFGIQQPDFALDNRAFSVFSSGVDSKADIVFGGTRGFFLGVQATFSRDRIGLKSEKERIILGGMSVGARTGYRFMLGKESNDYRGLYIVPWVVLLYSPNAVTIQRGGEDYREPTWRAFPTVHIGWRF